MTIYPTLADLETRQVSITQLAESIYPDLTFDTALPQDWVNAMTQSGFDPRGQVVWGYPPRCSFGQPYPLTLEAILALAARARQPNQEPPRS